MKRTLAVVAVLGLLLTACTSTGTTSSSTSGSTAPPSTAVGQGVTKDSIKLGVTYIDLSKVKDLVNIDHGDFPSAYQDVATYLNDNGGINGRKLELVDGPINPIDAASGAATCTKLTEDERVFAVIGEVQPNSVSCLITDHATPAVGGYISAPEAAAAKAPWFSWLPSTTWSAQQTIKGELAKGTFDGKKVAVVAPPASQSVMTDVVVPMLKDAGVQVVDTAVMTPNQDAASSVNESQTFAERFRSDGADTVVVLDVAFIVFAQGLGKTDYRPQLVSTNTQQVLGYLARKDYSVMPGLVAGGPPSDTTQAADPAMKDCVDHVRSVDPSRDIPDPASVGPGHATFVSVFSVCKALTTFKLIAEKAGTTLNNDTFRNAGEHLGTVTIPGVGGPSTFTPDQPAGHPPVFLATYNPDTHSMDIESTPVK